MYQILILDYYYYYFLFLSTEAKISEEELQRLWLEHQRSTLRQTCIFHSRPQQTSSVPISCHIAPLSLSIYIYLSVAYIYTIYAEEAEKDAPVIGPLPPKTISMEKKE